MANRKEVWESGEWDATWFCWGCAAALYDYGAPWMLNATTEGFPADEGGEADGNEPHRKNAKKKKKKRRKGGKCR